MSDADSAEAREARRAARATWPGTVYRNGEHPPVDTSSMTAEECLGAVWRATRNAWALAGREFPKVPRSEWPGRVIRNKRTVGRPKDLADVRAIESIQRRADT